MKCKNHSFLFLPLLILVIFIGCKKTGSDPEKYTGNYAFTVITVEGWVNSESGPETNKVTYDGSVTLTYLKNKLAINYLPDEYIYPHVSEDGNLTYPEHTVSPSRFFEGIFDKKNLNFTFGFCFVHHSGLRFLNQVIVSGKRK